MMKLRRTNKDQLRKAKAASFLEFCVLLAKGSFVQDLLQSYDAGLTVPQGDGGFSTVFRMEKGETRQVPTMDMGMETMETDKSLPRFVACRQRRVASVNASRANDNSQRATAELWSEFAAELRLVSSPQVRGHPNILKLLSVEWIDSPGVLPGMWEEGLPTFVYEWAELGSLRAFTARLTASKTPSAPPSSPKSLS